MKKIILLLGALSMLCASPVYAFTSNTHATTLVRASSQSWSIADGSQTGLDFGSTGTFSFSFRVKLNSNGVTQAIISKGATGAGTIVEYDCAFFVSNKLQCDWVDTAGGLGDVAHWQRWITNAAVATTTGQWIPVTITVDLSANPTTVVYVYGVSVAITKSNGNTNIGSTLFDSTGTFVVGGGTTYDASPDFLDADVDDVRVFASTLSSSDVTSLTNTPCSFTKSEKGMWLFDNNGNDSSGNSNTLNNNGSATFTTSSAYSCPAVATPDDDDTSQAWFTIFQ